MQLPRTPDAIARGLGLGLVVIGAGALATAYTSEYAFGLEPCRLCLYQRIPYALMIALGLAVVVGPRAFRGVLLAAAALTFAAGAAIAAYHVGVEQHWWASAVCGGEIGTVTSPEQLLQGLQQAPEKPCDEVDWTFLGFSMASWNAVFSALMALALSGSILRLKAAKDG